MIPMVKNNNFSELILYSGRQPVQFKATRGYSIKLVHCTVSPRTWVFPHGYFKLFTKYSPIWKQTQLLFLQKLDIPRVIDIKHPAPFPRRTRAFWVLVWNAGNGQKARHGNTEIKSYLSHLWLRKSPKRPTVSTTMYIHMTFELSLWNVHVEVCGNQALCKDANSSYGLHTTTERWCAGSSTAMIGTGLSVLPPPDSPHWHANTQYVTNPQSGFHAPANDEVAKRKQGPPLLP